MRQTLSDVSAHIEDVEWGFPDKRAVDALRILIFSFARWISSVLCVDVRCHRVNALTRFANPLHWMQEYSLTL